MQVDVGTKKRHRPWTEQLRVGLQIKSILILTFLVVCVVAAGGWFYFSTTQNSLLVSDRKIAEQMAKTLGLAARQGLLEHREASLRRIANDFLRNKDVQLVAILDAEGRLVVTASKRAELSRWDGLMSLPVSVSDTRQRFQGVLTILAKPIVLENAQGKEAIVGAVRMVIDTSATEASLLKAQRRIGVIAATTVLCMLPLGYLLVWRTIMQPIRRLLRVARRLGAGDFAVRANLKRNDEIGELASAFDTMSDQIADMRDQLILANEKLENKVTERTMELEKINKQLRMEMAEKEDFLRTVSHDLNAPLRNIAGMATMAMMKWRDQLPEEVTARLQRIQDNVSIGMSMIAELLELSKIKTCPQRREVVNVGELLAELVGAFEFELNRRDITLEIKGLMPVLYVEKIRIREVFQNLIDNAIKYMQSSGGGRIEVGYSCVDGMHQFHVADSGLGIPEDQQEKIFHVFRRVEGQGIIGIEGKGIGLAVVKSIVSNYEGQAWVESELGRGATFFITLGVHCTRAPEEDESNADGEIGDRLQVDHSFAGR